MPPSSSIAAAALSATALLLAWAPAAGGATPAQTIAPATVDFRKQIAPYLKSACTGCHDDAKRTSGLSLATVAGLFHGGAKNGAVVYPGMGRLSPIVQYLRGERAPRMPLGGKAPDGMTVLLERWIDQGARIGGKAPQAPPAASRPAAPSGWPFTRPVATSPPMVKNAAWCRNPIDRFVLAGLEARGLHPAPEADRRTLIRRVAFDLTGLPPTPAEIDTFLRDMRPSAYERMVDRYLASPAYGERWGRHWLDLARYADSNGFEGDETRNFAWRYRDYVIRSFNADKPYDRFIREQLAGDELYPGNADALVATAFIRNGPWDGLAFDKQQQRCDFMTDVTDTTGSVFLGLTMGCARCHDHKYDPVPQRDYYRLQAFFTQVKMEDRPLPGVKTASGDLAEAMVAVDAGPVAEPQHILLRGDYRTPGEPVEPGFPVCLAGDHSTPHVTPPPGGESTGRRSALANWIASADNPQTARVMVNRVWQYHFGRGIVDTPSDFGRNGAAPTHPRLLDWLACSFVAKDEGGRMKDERRNSAASSLILHPSSLRHHPWSIKALHRLILTSATYRQSTQENAAASRVDPGNRLLWRFNRQRLEGEEIRDAMLALSGRLNRKMGGPGVFPTVQKEVLDTGSTHKWGSSPPADRLRRSVYVFQRRSLVLPIVDVFDGADMSGACPRRAVTTIAPQALTLLNGQFSRGEARAFAERVARDSGAETVAQVRRAYLLALGRPPSAAEERSCVAFLGRQTSVYRRARPTGSADEAASAALTDLCHVLYNTNEFVYVD